MATVQGSAGQLRVSEMTYAVDLTTIDVGQNLDITVPSNMHAAEVAYVTSEVRVRATDGSPAFVSHIAASDVPASRTCRVVIDTVAGGSLTGMTLRLYLHFRAAGSGGLS